MDFLFFLQGVPKFPGEKFYGSPGPSCQFLPPPSLCLKAAFPDAIAPGFDRLSNAKIVEGIFFQFPRSRHDIRIDANKSPEGRSYFDVL